jgi:hypothetical protein
MTSSFDRENAYYSPRWLFRVLTALTAVMLLLFPVSIAVSVLAFQLYGRIILGEPWDSEAEDLINRLSSVITWATLATYPLSLFVFLKLVGRFNHNAWSFGARGMEFTSGWAIGWFFVPLANLVYPFFVMQEIWKASKSHDHEWRSMPYSSLISAWWVGAILSMLLGGLSRMMSAAGDAVALQLAAAVDIGADLVDATFLAIGWLMMRQIVAIQEARHRPMDHRETAAATCMGCGEHIESRCLVCPMCGTPTTQDTHVSNDA